MYPVPCFGKVGAFRGGQRVPRHDVQVPHEHHKELAVHYLVHRDADHQREGSERYLVDDPFLLSVAGLERHPLLRHVLFLQLLDYPRKVPIISGQLFNSIPVSF